MKDSGQKRVTVSIRLTPQVHEALRAEAARRVQAGERGFDFSRLVREAIQSQPWFPSGGQEG